MSSDPGVPMGDDEWEEMDERVVELVREHKREAARELLRAGIDRAAEVSPSWAGHFADLLGSLLLAESRDREALAAYLEAERLDPGDSSRVLSIANCLLYFMNRPAEALERLDKGLSSVTEDSWVYFDARGLRGVALLRLGRSEEAKRLFEVIATSSNRLPASSCDLRLVEDLVERRQFLPECRVYLDSIVAKANAEGNADVAARGVRIRTRLDAI